MKVILKLISLFFIVIMVNTAYASPISKVEYNEANSYISSYKKRMKALVLDKEVREKGFMSCASIVSTLEYGEKNYKNHVNTSHYRIHTKRLKKANCSSYLEFKNNLKTKYISSLKIVKTYEENSAVRNLTLIHENLDVVADKLKAKGVQVSVDKKPSSIKNAEKMLSILNNKLVDIHNSEQAIEEKQIQVLEQQMARENKQQKNVSSNRVEETVMNTVNTNNGLPSQSIISDKEIVDNSTSNTVSKLVLLIVGGWFLFSIVYSVFKGGTGEIVVFADYTDAALTFMSITLFPLLLGLILTIFEKELGKSGGNLVVILVAVQFIIIQAFAFRNLLYLNRGSIFVSAVSLTGRLFLSVLFLTSLSRIFDDKRKTFDRILYLFFTVFLGKLIKSLIAKQEFSSLGSFFDSKSLKTRFSEDFLMGMSFDKQRV